MCKKRNKVIFYNLMIKNKVMMKRQTHTHTNILADKSGTLESRG